MLVRIAELLTGMAIIAVILIDVFGTVVVPGRVNVGLGLPSFVRRVTLPLWRHSLGRRRSRHQPAVTSAFAAILLAGVFTLWLALLMTGTAMMLHALKNQFHPPLDGFGEALFQAGTTMMTLGLLNHAATGWSRAVIVGSGVCGLEVVTLTLSYIVQLQMALQVRDPMVLRLRARAGTPPTGLQLLLTQRELDLPNDLAAVFERWEEWAAALEQSHSAHPVLVHFRSGKASMDWVTALGAVLDSAVLVLSVVVDGPTGNAELLYRSGSGALRHLCRLLGIKPGDGSKIAPGELEEAIRALAAAGYSVRPVQEAEAEAHRLRSAYAEGISALADYFGVDAPDLVLRTGQAPVQGP